jgi:glycosyltransferase involved in cell wall biosynthesis
MKSLRVGRVHSAGDYRRAIHRPSLAKPSSVPPRLPPEQQPRRAKIAIIGTVGIPATYGGFETLVENLAKFHQHAQLPSDVAVYCSAKSYPEKLSTHLGAELRYIPLSANGPSSVLYDVLSLISAVRRKADVCLLLGVSGAVALPFVRLLSNTRIVTNVDGIEWKRAKWKGFSKWFLRFSEATAVRFSHEVIADNGAIAQHVRDSYGRECAVIAYGGDHAIETAAIPYDGSPLPTDYALSLCRIEPENNPDMILEAFSRTPEISLVFVGNWQNSTFGRDLKARYGDVPNVHLLDPIYDTGVLRTIRSNAQLYVHGHSAGGTNPSLVEMMHFGVPIVAYDCTFNRFSTEGQALFFDSAEQLGSIVAALTPEVARSVGAAMAKTAQKRYTWSAVGSEYFNLLKAERDLSIGTGVSDTPQESHAQLIGKQVVPKALQ